MPRTTSLSVLELLPAFRDAINVVCSLFLYGHSILWDMCKKNVVIMEPSTETGDC